MFRLLSSSVDGHRHPLPSDIIQLTLPRSYLEKSTCVGPCHQSLLAGLSNKDTMHSIPQYRLPTQSMHAPVILEAERGTFNGDILARCRASIGLDFDPKQPVHRFVCVEHMASLGSSIEFDDVQTADFVCHKPGREAPRMRCQSRKRYLCRTFSSRCRCVRPITYQRYRSRWFRNELT
jgi:hypothetical protein